MATDFRGHKPMRLRQRVADDPHIVAEGFDPTAQSTVHHLTQLSQAPVEVAAPAVSSRSPKTAARPLFTRPDSQFEAML